MILQIAFGITIGALVGAIAAFGANRAPHSD